MSRGERPAARAAASMASCAAGLVSSGVASGAIQPSARRPSRSSMRGPEAPSQIPTGWTGAGPVATASREYVVPGRVTDGCGSHMARSTVIA